MLCDDGAKVVELIVDEINSSYRKLPAQVSLQYLESKLQVRPQNIGMAFDDYIKIPLRSCGYDVTKSGKPARLYIKKIE